MERQYMHAKNSVQLAVEGLYLDLERRSVCRIGLGQLQIMIEEILSAEEVSRRRTKTSAPHSGARSCTVSTGFLIFDSHTRIKPSS